MFGSLIGDSRAHWWLICWRYSGSLVGDEVAHWWEMCGSFVGDMVAHWLEMWWLNGLCGGSIVDGIALWPMIKFYS